MKKFIEQYASSVSLMGKDVNHLKKIEIRHQPRSGVISVTLGVAKQPKANK